MVFVPVKSLEKKAAELSASKDWPDKSDPVLGKMHSIGWMAHREGFWTGCEWARKNIMALEPIKHEQDE